MKTPKPHLSALIFLSAFTFLSLESGCGSAKINLETGNTDAPHLVASPLTEAEAIQRNEVLSDISYALSFSLEDKTNRFSGVSKVQFNLNPKTKKADIFLDFYQGEITSILLNGTALNDFKNPSRYDGNRIYLKMAELMTGTNHLEIAFTHAYSSNGHGLHHFIDPVDQAVYLYSDLEPYFAHHIFPCFDQPDLKAIFQLTVGAPKTWQVVSNTRESKITNEGTNLKQWIFPPTQKLSTYVFALIAGEYKKFSSDAHGTPLRLFSRKSLAQYVDSKEWFDVTQKGLAFYGVQFGRPYPFLKYDQILVPEFNEGAMENAGAVTFSERMIYRTKETRLLHEMRANVILHEMAHMWFGDLVTMKWWNGLWLNESFATFMATWAMSEVHPIPGTGKNNSWESFIDEKGGAYFQDQLVTTHPIELPVPDTDHAFSNFDGITYGKGASVIKQLRYYLGDANFKKGIQSYFKKFAFQTTRLEDFIGSLAEASGKDLSSWQNVWLMTSGVNTVKAEWECKDGKISKFNLLQLPAENSTVLRPHRSEIGLYHFQKSTDSRGKIKLIETIPAIYEASNTSIDQAIGRACPDLVFPNANDQDYVKVGLDSKTLSEISAHLTSVDDILSKKMFWFSLHSMLTDGTLSAKQFADLMIKQLPDEKNLQVLQVVLQELSSRVPGYMNPELRNEYYQKFEALTLARIKESVPGSDDQLIWFQAFVDFAHSDVGKKTLRDILDSKMKIPKLNIDQEVRWSLVGALARRGAPDAKALIEQESKADPTEMGKKSALAAEVGRPDADLKAKWANIIFEAAESGSTGSWDSSDIRTIMNNFNILGQEPFTEAVFDRYFKFLPEAMKSPDENYILTYTSSFFPGLCSQRDIDFTVKALNTKLPIVAEKNLKVMKQETERCIRGRKL